MCQSRSNIAIDQRSRTQKVRGAWSQGENLKLMQAVHEMGTSWTATASAEILPGRSVRSITNHYHRDLKNGPGPLCETISNEESVSVYDALQIWNDSPNPFQRDCASRVLSSSELISKISTESPTIARLVDAMSSADPRALQDALKHNSLELIESRNGCVDLDVWSFCIGSDFIPVKIPNLLNDAVNAGNFNISGSFAPKVTVKRKLSDKRAQKIFDIESIMKLPLIAEFCLLLTLLELGFVAYCMATKLGELQQQSACANHLVAFKLVVGDN